MTRAVDGPLRRQTDASTAGDRRPGRVRPYGPAGVFVDTWRATRAGPDALRVRQARRLVDLVRHARARSPLYAQHYRGIRGTVDDVRQLPPVTKPLLMDRFDEWVCDPAVTRTAVEAFTADPSRIGQEFLGRYLVWTTSGTSGVPALLVQDRAALAVYTPVSIVRGYMTCSTPLGFLIDVAKVAARGGRIATLLVTGGHHGGAVMVARAHRRHPRTVHRNRLLSVLRPLEDLVDELNRLQPAVLHGYPSALTLLAGEQEAGRLHIAPVLMGSTGETLTTPARQQIETAFGCRLRNSYGSSEAGAIAFACNRAQLHVNTDWVIVEPVDRHHRPVEPGTASHTVLVTNLANRVQPVIRYDLGDSITWHPNPCPCGSPLPAITVHGRADDVLTLPGRDHDVRILPLALGTVAEDTPGVHRAQIIQTGPSTLTVRFTTHTHSNPDTVWEQLHQRLDGYLTDQHTSRVTIERSALPPAARASGKYLTVQARSHPDSRPTA